jgi:hypothetical protein
MAGEQDQVPDGAAVFPSIPAELGCQPLLLAVVHATVFLAGSDEHIVQPDAADEAVEAIAAYLQRLEGEPLRRVKEDMACLVLYARQQKWPRGLVQSLRTFLADLGVEADEETDEEA